MIKKSTLFFCVLGALFLFPMLTLAADYVHVPAMVFSSETGTETFQKEDNGDKSYFFAKDADVAKNYYAPVYFPSSAKGKPVKRMSVRLYDNISDFPLGRVTVYLRKVAINSGKVIQVCSVDSGAISTLGELVMHDDTPIKAKINNNKFAWYIRATFGSGQWGDKLRVYSVRIEY